MLRRYYLCHIVVTFYRFKTRITKRQTYTVKENKGTRSRKKRQRGCLILFREMLFFRLFNFYDVGAQRHIVQVTTTHTLILVRSKSFDIKGYFISHLQIDPYDGAYDVLLWPPA